MRELKSEDYFCFILETGVKVLMCFSGCQMQSGLSWLLLQN